MNQTMRKWTPYEQTQLSRHGLSDLQVPETNHQPVEYLTGRVEFLGWQLHVSPAVLIPRVETEELVELVVADLSSKVSTSSNITIVDVATGSGAIGLSLWRLLTEKAPLSQAQLSLTDISPAALAVAQQNWQEIASEYKNSSAALPIPQFLTSDLLANWSADSKIDCLIANLPYIPTARIAELDPSVKDFEPQLALDGGVDGLKLIERLLHQAKNYLAQDGIIWLEVDETHTSAALAAVQPDYNYQFFNDSFGKPRFVKATRRL